MRIVGVCMGVAAGKGNATIVTVKNEADGELSRELDVRCWGPQFAHLMGTIKAGDRVVAEGFVETKSWQRPGADGPPMRFTNFNAITLEKDVGEAVPADSFDPADEPAF